MQKRSPMLTLTATLAAVLAITALATVAAAPPNLAKAIEEQRRLTQERPDDPGVWNDLGNLFGLARRQAEAEEAYRKAVELDPKRVSALFNLGLLEQQQGRSNEALEHFRKVVEIEPGHAWAHYQIGAIDEKRGDKTHAIKAYAEAFALDPQLAFPAVNPQLVESQLVTQALLVAYREGPGTPGVPKQYEEPGRIADLLVPPVEQPGANAPKAEEAAAAPAPAGPPKVLRQSNLPAGTSGQVLPAPGQQRPGYNLPYQPPGGYTTLPGNAMQGTAGRNWTRPDPRVGGAMGGGTQPGAVVTPPPSGIYYRPGLQSTGQLSSGVSTPIG